MMQKLSQVGRDGLYFFALLSVLLIPFPFHLFPFKPAELLFGALIRSILHDQHLTDTSITSDSTSMYLLISILFILGYIMAIIFQAFSVWTRQRDRALSFFDKIFVYYLVLQFLKYGFDKVFKGQFYMPEPNILYTPFGQLDRDILYWSTMGTSYLYSLMTGLLELLAAFCLLFKRTRVFGLLLTLFILLNVVTINLGFDISVKLFSFFLLFLVCLLLSPQAGRLYRFMIQHETTVLKREKLSFPILDHPFVRISVKSAMVGVLLLEALYPVIKSRSFNDDLAQRPFLHGAYEVIEERREQGAVEKGEIASRFFIHRDGFIIFQKGDKMYDGKIVINAKQNQFMYTDYKSLTFPVDYQYDEKAGTLTLEFFRGEEDYLYIKGKALDWRKQPALQKQFHWTSDGETLRGK